MGLINISDVQPGMVLSDDVQDRHGQVLLRKGETIVEKHVKIFRMWGVTDLNVTGTDEEVVETRSAEAFDPALVSEAETVAQERFRHADANDPVICELMRLFKYHYLLDHQREASNADEPT
ncbi:MAG TPA: hypothetical protein VEO56_12450 [Bacteroidota bacterium]|nr:hypothetical protein [Bacteroidota bacterium]